jgi:hypothetical protein
MHFSNSNCSWDGLSLATRAFLFFSPDTLFPTDKTSLVWNTEYLPLNAARTVAAHQFFNFVDSDPVKVT